MGEQEIETVYCNANYKNINYMIKRNDYEETN